MTYFLNPVEEERCLFISCEGEMRSAELFELHQQLTTMLARHSLRRVLIGVTCADYISTALELFMFASGAFSDLPRGTRIALVVRPGQARHAKVLEEFMGGSGVQLMNFGDPQKAEAWLKMGFVPQVQYPFPSNHHFEYGKIANALKEPWL